MRGTHRPADAGPEDSGRREPPRFIVDVMLGRLARWLRLLGYDVAYEPARDDREIARVSARERRIVLTRDRGLLARRIVRNGAGGILVDSDVLDEQLAIVFTELGVHPDRALLMTRCSICNAPLSPASREELAGRVPPYVRRTATRFSVCDGCGKVYWDGTHRGPIDKRLERIRRRAEASALRTRRGSNGKPERS